jgi:hypothetical protein
METLPRVYMRMVCLFAFRRNPSLTGQEAVGIGPVNGGGGSVGGGGDLDSMKQEILAEMRREMQRMKIDIIEGIHLFVVLYV